MMVQVNARGEVADFLDVNQFIPGRSAYECVAYSASLITFCGPPGHGPTGSVLEASNLAQYWYGREEGSNDSSNTNGMSLSAEYDMLTGMGLHYHALDANVQAVRDALAQGTPVMVCGAETGMFDMDLGDIIPYSWTPTGNHCIVASGVASDGNLLIHDCASIAPSGVRPGPRKYDASRMQLISATAVIPPWQGASMIPNGWQDDGTTLTAPNGVHVVHGFRTFVLANNWDPANWPLAEERGLTTLELSNPSLGGGTQQLFRWTVLEWTQARGVFVAWVGQEVAYYQTQYAKIYEAFQQAQAQIQQLETQLQQAGSGQAVTDIQAIKAAVAPILAKY